MTSWRSRAVVAVVAAATALSACAPQREGQTAASPPARHVIANASTFPLYQPSEVFDVVGIDFGPLIAIRKNDPGAKTLANYRGNEVVVATSATIGQLGAWMHKLESSPPQGLRATTENHVTSSDPGVMHSAGAYAASFETAHSDRVVVLVVVDPRLLREKFGSALDLVDKYQSVPGVMRGPIDDAMKQQLGYSVTEMLDPASPVGVAFRALKALETRDKRAIVLIDQHRAER
ncbi:MAG: hypothetical protein NVS3B7_17870 [Candidatus Elarobacter sp.]